ncbi:DUF3006 domain-containing protein [Halobacterium salinarum]|uniref:DUF3006 domain-containing protein n=1 Tax=Halobacterium salinarum TaxID=2242 RepID=UPI002553484B|nr:DUF3006 domain-containing protein [Halobacterium salinarum]MDL0119152.1 DUF3006 domain-containing protein [Halobacterium salinarum]MDL0131609.1 DUF3006 domain-containing protein [Halobacterium salinarum]MDL0134328.1 DUF3006 domain-containing protein [Halobacterium salinarum]
MTTKQFTGVLDRFEDDLAVILLEEQGDVVDEVVVERMDLPDEAAHPDAVLEVTLTDGDVTELVYDAAATANRKERAQSRFDRLAERPPNNDEDA